MPARLIEVVQRRQRSMRIAALMRPNVFPFYMITNLT
jgi:hypothetical protein